jgi:hypothetical protein
LKKLGAESIPVVSRGNDWTYAQILTDVSDFLDIEAPTNGILSGPELVVKLDMILAAAQRYIRQLPTSELDKNVRNRKRWAISLIIFFEFQRGFYPRHKVASYHMISSPRAKTLG